MDELSYARSLKEKNARLEDELARLKEGGGGGTSGGMEARVAKLEAHMEHVRAELQKLSAVPSSIATLQASADHANVELGKLAGLPIEVGKLVERVQHLPTKDELGNKLRLYIGSATGIIAAIVGLATLYLRVSGTG